MVKVTRRKHMKKIQVKKMNSKGTRKAPPKKINIESHVAEEEVLVMVKKKNLQEFR